MVIMKASKDSEAGVMPSEKLMTEMGNYNEELVKAGIMQAGEGLHPTSKGVRVRFGSGEPQVVTGPFTSGDLIAGFWMWKVKSMDEAIEWAKRIPNTDGAHGEVELRPVFEAEDFGEEFTPEARAQEERLRKEIEAKA
jgi:hypothetical protein